MSSLVWRAGGRSGRRLSRRILSCPMGSSSCGPRKPHASCSRAASSSGANVGIALRDNAESVVVMIAVWMLGATAVPIDFRANAIERDLLASEFDLVAIIEDRHVPAAGYHPIFIDGSWTETIAKHDRGPIWTGEGPLAPAFISLTSGTTGRPIGIVIDHERMLLRSPCRCHARRGVLAQPAASVVLGLPDPCLCGAVSRVGGPFSSGAVLGPAIGRGHSERPGGLGLRRADDHS